MVKKGDAPSLVTWNRERISYRIVGTSAAPSGMHGLHAVHFPRKAFPPANSS